MTWHEVGTDSNDIYITPNATTVHPKYTITPTVWQAQGGHLQ